MDLFLNSNIFLQKYQLGGISSREPLADITVCVYNRDIFKERYEGTKSAASPCGANGGHWNSGGCILAVSFWNRRMSMRLRKMQRFVAYPPIQSLRCRCCPLMSRGTEIRMNVG